MQQVEQAGPSNTPTNNSPKTAGWRRRTATHPPALAAVMITINTNTNWRKGVMGFVPKSQI